MICMGNVSNSWYANFSNPPADSIHHSVDAYQQRLDAYTRANSNTSKIPSPQSTTADFNVDLTDTNAVATDLTYTGLGRISTDKGKKKAVTPVVATTPSPSFNFTGSRLALSPSILFDTGGSTKTTL